MNTALKHHKQKTVVYIIIAIIVVIILGAYIYMTLSNQTSQQASVSAAQAAARITAERQAALVPITPTNATPAQTRALQAKLVKH